MVGIHIKTNQEKNLIVIDKILARSNDIHGHELAITKYLCRDKNGEIFIVNPGDIKQIFCL